MKDMKKETTALSLEVYPVFHVLKANSQTVANRLAKCERHSLRWSVSVQFDTNRLATDVHLKPELSNLLTLSSAIFARGVIGALLLILSRVAHHSISYV